jgi:hypothetical protein
MRTWLACSYVAESVMVAAGSLGMARRGLVVAIGLWDCGPGRLIVGRRVAGTGMAERSIRYGRVGRDVVA